MDYFDFNMVLPSPDHLGNDDPGAGFSSRTPVVTPLECPGPNDQVLMSVSYIFHSNALIDNKLSDLVLISSDQVFFYVHCYRILAASENGFASLLPSSWELAVDGVTPNLTVPEPAECLNIVLHTVYGMSATQFQPSFETVAAALEALTRYGVSPKRFAAPGMPLYQLVVSCAPHQPINTYALAASHNLRDVAESVSAHLLSYPLPTLTDETAARIGPLHLKKLFFLHFGRTEALKRLLLHPPDAHSETPDCCMLQQRDLTRAWALASAHIMWDARPDLSTHLLQASLQPLQKELNCPLCKLALQDRIASLVIQWASVKRTIQ